MIPKTSYSDCTQNSPDLPEGSPRPTLWRRTSRLLGYLIFALLGSNGCGLPEPEPTSSTSQKITTSTSIMLGAYSGNQGWMMSQITDLESWQGRKNAVINLFTTWENNNTLMNNLFGIQLPNIWKNDNVPLITWDPSIGTSTPTNITAQIASGKYDRYINRWGDQLKLWLSGPDGIYGNADDRRAYLRLAHEMNGNWYPWGTQSATSAQDFISMWRRVVGILRSKQLDFRHIQWTFCANATDVGGIPVESYFPGDAYVDWVAIDGYNWGYSATWSHWQTPMEIFDAMRLRLRGISQRPLSITEIGSTTLNATGTDINGKSLFLQQVFSHATQNGFNQLVWFNEDKEQDWAVFGGRLGDTSITLGTNTYLAYDAYKTSQAALQWVSPAADNPRILTDAEFAGGL